MSPVGGSSLGGNRTGTNGFGSVRAFADAREPRLSSPPTSYTSPVNNPRGPNGGVFSRRPPDPHAVCSAWHRPFGTGPGQSPNGRSPHAWSLAQPNSQGEQAMIPSPIRRNVVSAMAHVNLRRKRGLQHALLPPILPRSPTCSYDRMCDDPWRDEPVANGQCERRRC